MDMDTLLDFRLSCSKEMINSIIRQDNWLVRSECALSNGTLGGIFETQVNTKGEHTYFVAGRVKWKTGEKVGVR